VEIDNAGWQFKGMYGSPAHLIEHEHGHERVKHRMLAARGQSSLWTMRVIIDAITDITRSRTYVS